MTNVSDVDKLKLQVKLLLEIISSTLYHGLSTPDGLVIGQHIHLLRKLEDDLDDLSLEELLQSFECDTISKELLNRMIHQNSKSILL